MNSDKKTNKKLIQTEEKIKESEKKYQELFKNSIDAIFIAELKSKKIVDCNSQAVKLTGYSKKEILKMRAENLHPKDKIKETMRVFNKHARNKKIIIETEILKKDKKTRIPVSINASLVKIGKRKFLQGIFRDITESKKIEKELIKEKNKAQEYLDIARVIIVAINKKGEVVLVNKEGCELLGQNKKNIIGKNWFENFIPKNERRNIKKIFNKLMSGEIKPVEYFENNIITKKKEKKLIAWHNTLLRKNADKIIGTISSGEEITEKRKIEKKLQESEIRYRRLFESSKDAILILNAETGRIIDSNPFVQNLLGYSHEELIGKNVWEISPLKNVMANKKILKILQKKKCIRYENLPLETKTGKKKDVEFVSNVYQVGGINTIQCNIRDITDRVKAERALKELNKELEKKIKERTKELAESEEKYSALYKSSKDAIMILEPPLWKFTAGNPATIKMFKVKNEKDFISRTPWQYSPIRQQDGKLSKLKAKEMINIAMKKGSNFFEWTHKKITGEEFPATVLLTRMKIKNKIVLQATVRDITKRKKAEESLKESEEKLRVFFDSSPEIVILLGLDGKILKINNKIYEITGRSAKELTGKNIFKIKKFLTKKTKKLILKKLKARIKGKEVQPYIIPLINKKNKKIYFKIFGSLIKDESGKSFAEAIIATDITKERNIVKKLKELNIAKTNFLNMVSHELKTPLTAISAHIEILEEKNKSVVNKDKKICCVSLEAIKRNNEQLKFLINNLLEISRIQSKTFELNLDKINLRQIILEIIENLSILASQKKLKINFKSQKIPLITADKERIKEILNNIIHNAIKFTNEGNIDIRVKKQGEYIIIKVKDTGIGIKKQDIPNLFKKFFQIDNGLKRRFDGGGLGLAITKQLIKVHGGKIKVKSIYGKGSTFIVQLPIKHKKEYERFFEKKDVETFTISKQKKSSLKKPLKGGIEKNA